MQNPATANMSLKSLIAQNMWKENSGEPGPPKRPCQFETRRETGKHVEAAPWRIA
jgi:hypothetical protein